MIDLGVAPQNLIRAKNRPCRFEPDSILDNARCARTSHLNASCERMQMRFA
jgi:hypothetical protein